MMIIMRLQTDRKLYFYTIIHTAPVAYSELIVACPVQLSGITHGKQKRCIFRMSLPLYEATLAQPWFTNP